MEIRLPKVGDRVNVIEKRNYESGRLTNGIVKRLLSQPDEVHPRGNKVELNDGTVGRVVSFVDEVGIRDKVDPALREKLSREIREERSQPQVSPDRGNFRKREASERPVEEKISFSEIPGEDDLR